MAQDPASRAAQARLDIATNPTSFQQLRGCLDKVSYRTRKAAKLNARRLRDKSKLSVYKCPHCGEFHLTKAENHHRHRSDGGM